MGNKLILQKGYFHTITGNNGTGKSRTLTELSKNSLNKINKNNDFSRMICLSGTVFERFIIPKKNEFNSKYCYLGQAVNSNMFSGISPYYNLFKILCDDYNKDYEFKSKLELMNELFEKIGFEGSVEISLRNKKGFGTISKENKTHCLNFREHDNFKGFIDRFKVNIDNGCTINNISFYKEKRKFELNELSSGERAILLMILGLALTIKDNSIIFYDEPENSMHPKWQEYIVAFLQRIVRFLSKNSTVVIATHSPLIVSSINDEKSRIISFGRDNDWRGDSYSENLNIENVLYRVFNKITPKSHFFSVEISNILKDVIDNKITQNEAKDKLHELQSASLDNIQDGIIKSIISNIDSIKDVG
jgi:ATP-binding protein involved in virulence-like protein